MIRQRLYTEFVIFSDEDGDFLAVRGDGAYITTASGDYENCRFGFVTKIDGWIHPLAVDEGAVDMETAIDVSRESFSSGRDKFPVKGLLKNDYTIDTRESFRRFFGNYLRLIEGC